MRLTSRSTSGTDQRGTWIIRWQAGQSISRPSKSKSATSFASQWVHGNLIPISSAAARRVCLWSHTPHRTHSQIGDGSKGSTSGTFHPCPRELANYGQGLVARFAGKLEIRHFGKLDAAILAH
jgi:hypothetical protein